MYVSVCVCVCVCMHVLLIAFIQHFFPLSSRLTALMHVHVCVCVCVSECVYVCVCVRERVREREKHGSAFFFFFTVFFRQAGTVLKYMLLSYNMFCVQQTCQFHKKILFLSNK